MAILQQTSEMKLHQHFKQLLLPAQRRLPPPASLQLLITAALLLLPVFHPTYHLQLPAVQN